MRASREELLECAMRVTTVEPSSIWDGFDRLTFSCGHHARSRSDAGVKVHDVVYCPDCLKSSTSPGCRSCPYWARATGHCRADPPQFLNRNEGHSTTAGYWPQTGPDDWCGRHPEIAEALNVILKEPVPLLKAQSKVEEKPPNQAGPYALNLSIEELDERSSFSTRAYNCLIHTGVKTVRELTRKTEDELLENKGCGKVSLQEIKGALARLGLSLAKQ